MNYIQSTFCVPDPVPGMASAISAWPNKHFYDMQLVDSDEVATRKLGPIFEMKVAGLWDCKTYDDFQKLVGKQANFKLQKGPLQDIGNPFGVLTWLDTASVPQARELPTPTRSYQNVREAELIVEHIKMLAKLVKFLTQREEEQAEELDQDIDLLLEGSDHEDAPAGAVGKKKGAAASSGSATKANLKRGGSSTSVEVTTTNSPEKRKASMRSNMEVLIQRYTIGITSPYSSQVELLQYQMRKAFGQHILDSGRIKISSIDAFQGGEADIMIISGCRSNFRKKIGFCSVPPRLNVALTRARRCCIVVADSRTLTQADDGHLWRSFYQHVKSRGGVFDPHKWQQYRGKNNVGVREGIGALTRAFTEQQGASTVQTPGSSFGGGLLGQKTRSAQAQLVPTHSTHSLGPAPTIVEEEGDELRALLDPTHPARAEMFGFMVGENAKRTMAKLRIPDREWVLLKTVRLLRGENLKRYESEKEWEHASHKKLVGWSQNVLDVLPPAGAKEEAYHTNVSLTQTVHILWHMQINRQTGRQEMVFWDMVFPGKLDDAKKVHLVQLCQFRPEYLKDCLLRVPQGFSPSMAMLGTNNSQKITRKTRFEPAVILNTDRTAPKYGAGYECLIPELQMVGTAEGGKKRLRAAIGISRTKLYDMGCYQQLTRMLLTQKQIVLKLRLSEEEQEAVCIPRSINVMGRAGTGKTQVLVERGYAHQKSGVENPFVLFVTMSPTLALNVGKHYDGMFCDEKIGGCDAEGDEAWSLTKVALLEAREKCSASSGTVVVPSKESTTASVAGAAGAAGNSSKTTSSPKISTKTPNHFEEEFDDIGFAPLTPAERRRELEKQPKKFAEILPNKPYLITSYHQFLRILDRSVSSVFGSTVPDYHYFFEIFEDDGGRAPEAEVNFARFRENYYEEARTGTKQKGNMGLKALLRGIVALQDVVQVYKELFIIKAHIPFDVMGDSPAAAEGGGETAEDEDQGSATMHKWEQCRATLHKPFSKVGWGGRDRAMVAVVVGWFSMPADLGNVGGFEGLGLGRRKGVSAR